MPKPLPAFSNKLRKIAIGTKDDFTKLQVRRGVIGADTDAIRKAIEMVEKVTPKVSEVRNYVRPFDELQKATKAFDAKYGKKHPKFIADVKSDFLEPVEAIIEHGKMWQDFAAELPKFYLGVKGPLNVASAALTGSGTPDDAKLKQAGEAINDAKVLFRNATERLDKLITEFETASLRKILTVAEQKQSDFDGVALKFTNASKKGAASLNLGSIVVALTNLDHIAGTMAKAVSEASIKA